MRDTIMETQLRLVTHYFFIHMTMFNIRQTMLKSKPKPTYKW